MKNIFLILILTCTVASLNGQDIQSIIPHIPTSPQAEAFQRYGEYGVNYSTGVPDISIPLYEINHRGYKLPLALRYYPAALKPGYNYDVFGHGWALSISSCVSRTIEHYPDELKSFVIEEPYDYNYAHFSRDCPDNSCFAERNFAHDKFKAILPDGSSFDFVIDKIDDDLVYTVFKRTAGKNIT